MQTCGISFEYMVGTKMQIKSEFDGLLGGSMCVV